MGKPPLKKRVNGPRCCLLGGLENIITAPLKKIYVSLEKKTKRICGYRRDKKRKELVEGVDKEGSIKEFLTCPICEKPKDKFSQPKVFYKHIWDGRCTKDDFKFYASKDYDVRVERADTAAAPEDTAADTSGDTLLPAFYPTMPLMSSTITWLPSLLFQAPILKSSWNNLTLKSIPKRTSCFKISTSTTKGRIRNGRDVQKPPPGCTALLEGTTGLTTWLDLGRGETSRDWCQGWWRGSSGQKSWTEGNGWSFWGTMFRQVQGRAGIHLLRYLRERAREIAGFPEQTVFYTQTTDIISDKLRGAGRRAKEEMTNKKMRQAAQVQIQQDVDDPVGPLPTKLRR